MADHHTVIDDNIVSLCDYTNCTVRLLDKSMEKKILTRDESSEIKRQPAGYDRNSALYEVIRRKDGDAFANLVSVMEDKKTKQSKVVLSILKAVTVEEDKKEKTCVLKSKWWPEEKLLVNSFYERKNEQGLLVEELFKTLTKEGNQTTVISQKVTVSGFGGVGKTTMAKWYAKHYEDKYDHIIWIDCGEGSLIKSFVELSADLKVEQKQSSESGLKKLAKACFQSFEDKKCLFIFDNAERYIGCDGIKDALPKSENFHSIITSRNRDWGSESGYGQIQQILLDVFSTDESINFLKMNLKQKSVQEKDLQQLCGILGNLPLALQIATSTLNTHSVGFADYVKIIQKTDQIIGKNFDDYEKTINTTLKTSMDYIKQGENFSELAYRILLIFGYIHPDDVPIDFFEAVELCESCEIQAAMNLLETYSLVSVRRTMYHDESIDFEYSMHRLLQQVIRYNNKDTEEDTLRKILSCEGDIDFKLLPYTFAAESLKKEFPKLRAELVDQLQLDGLILSGQLDEACRLSRIIYTNLQTSASRFNHAICLKNCKLFDESLSHLRDMFNFVSGTCDFDINESELLSLQVEPTKIMVGSEIFIINMLKGDMEGVTEIFELIPNIKIPNTDGTLSCIIQAFNSNHSGFRLSIMANGIYLKRYTEYNVVDVLISKCTVSNDILKWKNLRELRLDYAKFTSEQSESIRTGTFFPPKLTRLAVITADFDIDGSEIPFGNPSICLDQLEYLQTLELTNCTITLTDVVLPMRLKSLVLRNVSFLRNDAILHEVILTDVINFSSIESLTLTRQRIEKSETGRKVLWLVDMTGKLNLNIVRLEGNSIDCQNWREANWTIDNLILKNVELKNNRLKVRDLEMSKSTVEVSDLPSTIQCLTLDFGVSFVRSSKDYVLQTLKYLHTQPSFSLKLDILPLLEKCPNLVGLKFSGYWNKECDEFDLSILPSTVRELHLKGVRITGDQVRHLERLLLAGYRTNEAIQILTKLRPEHLCHTAVFMGPGNNTNLAELIQCQVKSIALGPIFWTNFENCILSSYVDEEAEFYLFQNQRGVRMDNAEFHVNLGFPPIRR